MSERLLEQIRDAIENGTPPTSRERLRDEFAMAALIGLFSKYGGQAGYSVLAQDAYTMADAMLAAREKPEAPK